MANIKIILVIKRVRIGNSQGVNPKGGRRMICSRFQIISKCRHVRLRSLLPKILLM